MAPGVGKLNASSHLTSRPRPSDRPCAAALKLPARCSARAQSSLARCSAHRSLLTTIHCQLLAARCSPLTLIALVHTRQGPPSSTPAIAPARLTDPSVHPIHYRARPTAPVRRTLLSHTRSTDDAACCHLRRPAEAPCQSCLVASPRLLTCSSSSSSSSTTSARPDPAPGPHRAVLRAD